MGRMKVGQVLSPVGQGLQDGGHQHPRDGLVEDGVAHPHDVHHRRGAQDRQHVGGHALPEVEQEALHLNEPTRSVRFSSTDEGEKFPPISWEKAVLKEERSPRQSWPG